ARGRAGPAEADRHPPVATGAVAAVADRHAPVATVALAAVRADGDAAVAADPDRAAEAGLPGPGRCGVQTAERQEKREPIFPHDPLPEKSQQPCPVRKPPMPVVGCAIYREGSKTHTAGKNERQFRGAEGNQLGGKCDSLFAAKRYSTSPTWNWESGPGYRP